MASIIVPHQNAIEVELTDSGYLLIRESHVKGAPVLRVAHEFALQFADAVLRAAGFNIFFYTTVEGGLYTDVDVPEYSLRPAVHAPEKRSTDRTAAARQARYRARRNGGDAVTRNADETVTVMA